MDVVDLNKFVEDSYLEYGKEVDLRRSVPNMFDGLKPVYRKLILAAMEYPKDKWIDTIQVEGTCKGKYYVHGESSLDGVVDRLVQSGIFDGKGAFGKSTLTRDLPGAAPRYSKVKISNKYRDIFDKLLKYVPTFNNDLDIPEPEYLPSFLPLGLLLGTFGFGLGLIVRMPPMDPKSLVESMRDNNPMKLKSAYGFELTPQEKMDFWTKSNFSFTYKFKWTKDSSGYHIFGDGTWVKPRYPDLYSKEDVNCENPRYQLIDNFGENRSDVTLIPYSKEINDEVINKACTVKVGNVMWVVDPFTEKVKLINGYNLLKNCYDNYKRLYEIYKLDKLKDLRIKLEAYIHFKDIADRILNTNDSLEKITNDLKLTSVEVTKYVSNMPVGTLRNGDQSHKVESLKSEIKEVEKYDVNSILDTI